MVTKMAANIPKITFLSNCDLNELKVVIGGQGHGTSVIDPMGWCHSVAMVTKMVVNIPKITFQISKDNVVFLGGFSSIFFPLN